MQNIEGKGKGCVATRRIKIGTLIIQEDPQMSMESSGWTVKNYMHAFSMMTNEDQTEYMCLHNRFSSDPNLLSEEDKELMERLHRLKVKLFEERMLQDRS